MFILECDRNRIKLDKFGAFRIEKIDGLSGNNIKFATSQSIGQVGESINASMVDGKNINISGIIAKNVKENRAMMIKSVVPLRPIRFLYEELGCYINCYALKTPIIDNSKHWQKFQIALYAPYPYWIASDVRSTQMAGIEALFRFPLFTGGTWALSRTITGYFRNIENKGNAEIPITIEMSAHADTKNPIISHVEKNQFICYNDVLRQGERLTITTEYGNQKAILTANDISKNVFAKLDIDSTLDMTLSVGSNTLSYDASDNRDGLDVRIIAPIAIYLGV